MFLQEWYYARGGVYSAPNLILTSLDALSGLKTDSDVCDYKTGSRSMSYG